MLCGNGIFSDCINMVFINTRTDLKVDDPRHSYVTKLQNSLPFLRDRKTKRMFLNRPVGDMQTVATCMLPKRHLFWSHRIRSSQNDAMIKVTQNKLMWCFRNGFSMYTKSTFNLLCIIKKVWKLKRTEKR